MLSQGAGGIQLVDVAQGYGRKLVLDGLNLKIGAGVTAILGPNGAGKTTLLRTLVTEIPPRAGVICMGGGRTDSRAGLRAARRSIGFLPQNFIADPAFTVQDLVRYAAWLREADTSDTEVVAALEAVDLLQEAKTRIRALSGGMRQRAAIAATLIGDPEILAFDEPTVGLDPEQRVYFRKVLDLHRHRTIILSTHLIEDVVASADRVVVMAKGRICFDGTPQQLTEVVDSSGNDRVSDAEQGYLTVIERSTT